MNLKESIEASNKMIIQNKTVASISDTDVKNTILQNQVVIMETLSDLKKGMQELAMSISNG